MLNSKTFIIKLRQLAKARTPKRIYFYSIIVGIISGFSALGFFYLVSLAENFTFITLAGIDMGAAAGEAHSVHETLTFRPIVFFLLPVIGALISGLLVYYLAPEAGGAGTDAMIECFHEREGLVKTRTPFVKTLATISILSGGGSAGKEGPISQVGSAIGSLFAQYLGLGERARRALFLAGMAGALGAIFRAPIGAAITAVEVLYKEDFESDSLIPCILSSITGYFVFTSIHGMDHIFQLPAQSFSGWYSLFFYTALGLACMVFGAFFVKMYHSINKISFKINLPFYIKVTIGGFLVGCIGLISYDSIGSGFGFLQKLMEGESNIKSGSLLSGIFLKNNQENHFLSLIIFLLAVVILKILATSFTIGTGGSGGVFGPSLVIGGTIGAIVGLTANHYYPEIVPSYIPFVVVGMGGFFAGVANAPIAAMIMVSELTGSYELLAPLSIVSLIAIIFSNQFNIYPGQRINKFESPAHRWDMTTDLLIHMKVEQYLDKTRDTAILGSNISLRKTYKISDKISQTDFLIKDETSAYKGIFSLRLLTPKQKQTLPKSDKPVIDYINTSIPALKLTDSLSRGLDILLNYDTDKVAVVKENDTLTGYLTFKDILHAYHKMVNKKSVKK
ncbi:MAG: chloride channel protein [Spirochaetia bacterium]|nr:chloride channel protein [Spirochaetia bacterium]